MFPADRLAVNQDGRSLDARRQGFKAVVSTRLTTSLLNGENSSFAIRQERVKHLRSTQLKMISDFITGAKVKCSEKEKVRQEIVRQLTFRYQVAPELMATDFPIGADGVRRSVI